MCRCNHTGLSCNCQSTNQRGMADVFSDVWNSVKKTVTNEAKDAVTDVAAGTVEKVTPVIQDACKEGAKKGVREYLPLTLLIIGGYTILCYGLGVGTQAVIYKWKKSRNA